MNLKEHVENFNLKAIGNIDTNDKDQKISDAFKPIALRILSGHFLVQKNNSDSFVTVHPTCVEMYYHEEGNGNDKIKDYIVYHRDSDDGNRKKTVFQVGVLHNHVSGIDITFEKLGDDGNPIRFSALIKEFWVDKSNKQEENVIEYGSEDIKAYNKNTPENRSTYLYESLYSQYSAFDGFSIKWEDCKDEEIIKDCLVEPRMNVAEYKLKETDGNRKKPIRIPKKEADGMLTKNNKYKQCQRMWRYSIKQD